MLNPGQAEPGGLGNLIAQQPSQGAAPTGINPMTPMLSQLPVQTLITEFLNPNSTTPKFAVLSAIQKAQERMRMSQAMQGMAAQQAVAQHPGTVAQEILAAGIGSQPYEFAGGGLVAFERGGMTTQEPPLTMEDIDTADLDDQMAFGYGFADTVAEAQALAADEARVAAANEERRRAEVRERYNFLRQNAPETAARVLAENPWLERTQVGAPTPAARPAPAGTAAGAGTRPAPAGTAAGTRPAAAGAGAGAGAGRPGAGARPGAAQVPPPDDIAQYTSAAESAIGSMEGRGRPGAEELELRKALLAAQEAERLPSMEYKEPSGLTGRELLQLASFDPTKGRWMGSLAERAAGVMGAREAKAEEAKKANREIDIANRRLNTALAQQRLAYASTDRKAREEADLAVANARVALREKVVQFGLESRKVGAQERQAGAAEAAAQARADQRAEGPQITPAQRVQLLREAANSVEKDAVAIAQLARITDPAQKEQRKQELIQQRYQALLAQLTGAAPTAPAATGATLSAEDRALIDKYK